MKRMNLTVSTILSGLAVVGMATIGAPKAEARSQAGSDNSRSSVPARIRIGGLTVFWRNGNGGDGYYDNDGRLYRRDADGSWSRHDRDAWPRYGDHGHGWSRDDNENRDAALPNPGHGDNRHDEPNQGRGNDKDRGASRR